MTSNNSEKFGVLKLTLHNVTIGYLSGFSNGRNIISFTDDFKSNPHRPTLSLITSQKFPRSNKFLSEPIIRRQKLHPILSNLLPEGAMRDIIARALKVSIEDEFNLISFLGNDLPGALICQPVDPELVSDIGISNRYNATPIKLKPTPDNKFSLAGVQIKFSMKEVDDRYTITNDSTLGDWIIKTPSIKHHDVPFNEYSGMILASLVGVDIPEIRLVEMNKLTGLPQVKFSDENMAFAIKRFDRRHGARIHTEDFAQVLAKYPHEKYNAANYENIGQIIYQYSFDGLKDIRQFANRLLVNILLANGDAHLKNWSLIYDDMINPRLAPAYDILTTSVYIENEQEFALNLAKNKNWYKVSYDDFKYWCEKAGAPWRAIKSQLDETMDKARSLWKKELQSLPMNEQHKSQLTQHWSRLNKCFQIK